LDPLPVLVIVSTWPGGFACPWVALKLRSSGDIPTTGPAPGPGVGVPGPGVGVPGPTSGVPGPGEAVGCPPPEIGDENGNENEAKTINCTITVCVRRPVKKAMKALYVPGERFPTFTAIAAVAMLASSKRPLAGVTLSQLTEVNACQSMIYVQPAVAPRPKTWPAELP